jgi:hypothetical protein
MESKKNELDEHGEDITVFTPPNAAFITSEKGSMLLSTLIGNS